MRRFVTLAAALLLLALAACDALPTSANPSAAPATAVPTTEPSLEATQQPSLAATSAPSETVSPAPSATATAAPSATAQPTDALSLTPGERYEVAAGGFSFVELEGLLTQPQDGGFVLLGDAQGRLMITLGGATNPEGRAAEELLEWYAESLKSDSPDLEQSLPFWVELGEVSGLAADVTGSLYGTPYQGRIAVALPADNHRFLMFVATFLEDGADWATVGEPAFNTIAASLEFFPPELGPACAAAQDTSYAYTPENPVRIGGGPFDGPSRERAYLDNLRGPGGEVVTYQRNGSTAFGDTILDIYTLNYEGIPTPVVIYVDEYTYAELMAPAGFLCAGPLPFGAP